MKLRIVFVASVCLWAAAATGARAADATALYDRIADAYMTGRFEDLDTALAEAAKRMVDFTPEQRTDVLYVRAALAECRPTWWAACKQGKRVRIRQPILGRRFEAFYDPQGEGGVRMNTVLGGKRITVSWKPEEMDSTDKGMYGYLLGDQRCVNIWSNLGLGQLYAVLPMSVFRTRSERDKLRLNRYMSFRGNLVTLYHTTPPGRRYALHIYFASFFYDNWGKSPAAGARRAPCSFVMMEILKDPSLYPSLKLPRSLPAENAEEALGKHFKHSIKRTAVWTIAEDRRFREAIKPFAAANDRNVLKTGKVPLPNDLVFVFDVDADAADRAKRDAWFKQQFDKVTGGE